MSQYSSLEPSPLSAAQLEQNFQEIQPALTNREAVVEANRCLFCYDAPCTHACPTHIDIPGFIKKIATDNLRGSARVILESNFLGSTCARVCPVQELCEGACVLGSDHKPIEIGRLQRFATDYVLERKLDLFKPAPSSGKKVVVIGAGPAGLSCAAELAKRGHKVTVLEKKPLAGGLSTYGIVVFREPVEVSLAEVEMVKRLGVEIKTGITVGKDVQIKDLEQEYDALFLSIGLGNVPNLSIAGEDLGGVVDGIDFIELTKTQPYSSIPVGKNVAVIGAGNTAIDAATIAKRLGAARVTMVYRRSEAEMTAYDFEYEFAKQEGIEYRFLTAPVAIHGDSSGVKSLECVQMRLGEPDQSGRPRPEVVQGSNHHLSVDMVIKAIGQNKQTELAQALGLELKNGYIVTDEYNATSNPKVFAGGDCVRLKGAASTVMAVQDGKIAAQAIHAMFMGV
ncbi:MAG: NAD(P)-dependent oxidoreductase [Deinococcales bacterium]